MALRCQRTASRCGLESRNTFSTPAIAVTSEPSSARSPVTACAAAGRPPAASPARTSARTCWPLPPLPLGLVWCASRENPRIRAFNDVARSMSAARPQ